NLRETYVADRKGRDVAVGIDPHGRLHYGQDNAGGDHIIAVLGQHVSDAYLAELREDGVSYLFAGKDGTDLHEAMRVLGEPFGIKTILLEGGG
ncbi:5-amino-6-(5-phosphoribosylamino)uracil reductase, partial [Mesorhizobium sp. M1D.F.Ca.ET.234.01.1.1]